MSNSSLVSYTLISPNKNSPRKYPIDRISIHCVVGQCSVETLGSLFSQPTCQASSNYGVGKDGRIGMFVEEKDRSWCTSSAANDHRAITVEVASDATHPYAVKDAVFAALLDLVTDICKRNGKKKLLWFGDKDKTLAYTPAADEMVLTVHRWFANKSCPGDYLYNRYAEIAATVTKRLNPKEEPAVKETRYNSISELPDFAKPTITKLVDNGFLQGSGGAKDKDGRPADLDLSIDMVRLLVIHDRAGLYDA